MDDSKTAASTTPRRSLGLAARVLGLLRRAGRIVLPVGRSYRALRISLSPLGTGLRKAWNVVPGHWLLAGCLTILASRRWLLAAMLVTAVLLAMVLLAPPATRIAFISPEDPEVAFDDITLFPPGTGSGSSKGARQMIDQKSNARAGEKSSARNGALTLESPTVEEDVEPPKPMAVSRRLEAVRSRQARGAWLTGTIEEIGPRRPHAELACGPNRDVHDKPASPGVQAVDAQVRLGEKTTVTSAGGTSRAPSGREH